MRFVWPDFATRPGDGQSNSSVAMRVRHRSEAYRRVPRPSPMKSATKAANAPQINKSTPTWKNSATLFACSFVMGRFPQGSPTPGSWSRPRAKDPWVLAPVVPAETQPSCAARTSVSGTPSPRIVNQVRKEFEERVLLRRHVPFALLHQGFDNRESAFILLLRLDDLRNCSGRSRPYRFRSRSSIVVLIASIPLVVLLVGKICFM